jgi:hypothetical protein
MASVKDTLNSELKLCKHAGMNIVTCELVLLFFVNMSNGQNKSSYFP